MLLNYNIFSVPNTVIDIDSSIHGGWGSGGLLEESQDDTWKGHEEGPKGGSLEGLRGHRGGGHMEILYNKARGL